MCSSNNLIYEGDGVVDSSMACHWWKLLHPTVGSPFITVYNCPRMKVLLNDGSKVAAFHCCIYPRAGTGVVSTVLNTQTSFVGGCLGEPKAMECYFNFNSLVIP